MSALAIYIHWPFCLSKCPYCDFNSRPIASDLDEAVWEMAYRTELAHYAALLGPREISSIYFGGGTPSLMRPATIAAIMDEIAALCSVQQNCEVTIEANPTSSEIEKFRAFKEAGINRISIGVQALNDADLKFLGRQHDKNAAQQAIESAQKVFDRFSFDLIYARAGQTPAAWEAELQHALSFGAQHLSLYQLTIEEGTSFFKRAEREMLQATPDHAAEMFERTQEVLAAAGLPAYEVSNHASPGQESRHNLTYWHYDDYIGIGPGAHGRFVDNGGRFACENHRKPENWINQVRQTGEGSASRETLDIQTAQREALLMGLRLVAGIDVTAWQEKFGSGFAEYVGQDKITAMIGEGLMQETAKGFAATLAGRQRLNAVLAYLV